MKIFYHCYGSTHTSVVCAAIHLGKLPEDRVPGPAEIDSLPLFDRLTADQIGQPHFFGRDEHGHELYAIGFGSARGALVQSARSLLDIYGVSPDEALFPYALGEGGLLVKIGGILSRRFGIVAVGRPLAIMAVRRHYRNFVDLVREVKKEVARRR